MKQSIIPNRPSLVVQKYEPEAYVPKDEEENVHVRKKKKRSIYNIVIVLDFIYSNFNVPPSNFSFLCSILATLASYSVLSRLHPS